MYASSRRAVVQLLCFVAVCSAWNLTASAQPADFRVGDRVVATVKVALRVPDGETAGVSPGFALTVSEIEGDWLWVSSGKAGWIHRGNVVRLDEALQRFDSNARRSPNDPRWQYARALVADELGNSAAAIEDLSQLIRRYPEEVPYYLSRGIAHFAQGDPDAAVADFTSAIEIDGENGKAWNNRANVYVNQGEYDKAVADLDEAIRLDEKNSAAFNNRGHAYEMQGNYDRAMTDYRKATELDSKYALAFNNLAWLTATCPLEEIRNAQTALNCAKTACELTQHQHPLFLSTLAAAQAEHGEFETAVETQRKANRLAEDRLPEEFQERLKAFEQGKSFRQGRAGE